MKIKSILNKLLDKACPSIKYRLMLEILGQSRTAPVMLKLQQQILSDDAVRIIVSTQKSDGWIGRAFHGTGSVESGVRFLCERGIDPNNAIIADALSALVEKDISNQKFEEGIGKPGRLLDTYNLGGIALIRAVIFARAGVENKSFIENQISAALSAFRFTGKVNNLEDVAIKYKNKLVFRDNAEWPSIYHLRLLAFNQSWRNGLSNKMITASIKKLIKLSPIPDIKLRHNSQLIAPANYCMRNFNLDVLSFTGNDWLTGLHCLELLARLGVISNIPSLCKQVRILIKYLSDDTFYLLKLDSKSFINWGAYTGMMLESDWRDSQRKYNDLAFRIMLIAHYSGMLKL